MEIDRQTLDKVEIFRLNGRLDAAATTSLKESLDTLMVWGERALLLNLEKVHFIDSTGLGLVVSLYRRQREKKRRDVFMWFNAPGQNPF